MQWFADQLASVGMWSASNLVVMWVHTCMKARIYPPESLFLAGRDGMHPSAEFPGAAVQRT